MPVLFPYFIFNIAGKEWAILYTKKTESSNRNVECCNAKHPLVMGSEEISQLKVPISIF